MLSVLEQRQIIESAFLPLNCRCSVTADDAMVVRISDPLSGSEYLKTQSIPRTRLGSCWEISELIMQLRHDLNDTQPLRRSA